MISKFSKFEFYSSREFQSVLIARWRDRSGFGEMVIFERQFFSAKRQRGRHDEAAKVNCCAIRMGGNLGWHHNQPPRNFIRNKMRDKALKLPHRAPVNSGSAVADV